MGQDTHALYLHDTLLILSEMANEAKQRRDEAIGTDDFSYSLGYLMAFHEIVSLVQSQAISFDLSLENSGIDVIVPDRDLL